MRSNSYFDKGLLYLKNKEYGNAVECFKNQYEIDYSSQSYEAFYSSIILQINYLKSNQQPFDYYKQILEFFIMESNSYEQAFGFTYSTITKAKLSKKFKILALLFHPDKSNTAKEVFIKIKETYNSLLQDLESNKKRNFPDFNQKNLPKKSEKENFENNENYEDSFEEVC